MFLRWTASCGRWSLLQERADSRSPDKPHCSSPLTRPQPAINLTPVKTWMFYWFIGFGVSFMGFGINEVLRGEPALGWIQFGIGIAWIVISVLRRKGIMPKARDRPPAPNPYQESLPS